MALLLTATAALGLGACREDDGGAGRGIRVTVLGLLGDPVPEIPVELRTVVRFGVLPELLQAETTDAAGVAVFTGVDIGTYDLYASLLDREFRQVVTVAGDSLRNEVLRVDEIAGTDPRLFAFPDEVAVVPPDTVQLTVIVLDDRTAIDGVTVTWREGGEVLLEARTDGFGESRLGYGAAVAGRTSVVTVEALDGDGRTATDTFLVTGQ